MKTLLFALALIGAGCTIATTSVPPAQRPQAQQPAPQRVSLNQATRNFQAVIRRVEPVAEQVCRQRDRRKNCDFRIIVDPDASLPPNAYQTLDKNGRPIIGFTQALLAGARNRDELAFILGHEAAHHIRDHIPRQQRSALAGAAIGTLIGALAGGGEAGADFGQQLGGTIGGRRFSKDFELQADELGAQIARAAGYDALRGAQYFARIPDPGNRFLGSHPPNAARLERVRWALRQ